MAFTIANMTPISNGPKCVFQYHTDDTLATVVADDYFNDYAAWLKVGDVIHVSGDLDGTPAYNAYMVLTNTYTHAAGTGDVTTQASA